MIEVELKYVGYLAMRAGRSREKLVLEEGTRADQILDHVLERCDLAPEQGRHLFVNVNGSLQRTRVLRDGDRVAVGIMVGGG